MSLVDYHADWKPAPYPLTEEERLAAAKKYNLLPEDYKPYKKDQGPAGDYPHLEAINFKYRDPFEHYDYYPLKMNYNEPAHWDLGYILFRAYAPIAIMGLVFYLFGNYYFFPPMMAKPFPTDGTTFYTFDPVD
ncbi:NADH dehydrogenase 1 beta subcomplex subunit 8 ndufb8 [Cichlidogyrus casuarinus]|uniref:NADH dehydrogenase 1 beta subcomplex subunit 8 ndufb8 n=1 Tax=Cichlidogyrus casuarinus TaxID=1844966 RepID=A0ABD2Q8Z4_9PLAT